jgi:two-component system, cell cycle sensor histidine kinase and response regulator CckA
MDAQTAAQIFEPFYTTRAPGRGTGMGLATVKRIVDEAGGTIRVDTTPGKGTRMTVRLPQIDGNSRRPHLQQSETQKSDNRGSGL